jgi:hypothetical protein
VPPLRLVQAIVDILIPSRALMGVGAALTIPSSLCILNDVFRDPGQRARATGAWGGIIGLGIAIGPIAGGLLLARFWWGSVFLGACRCQERARSTEIAQLLRTAHQTNSGQIHYGRSERRRVSRQRAHRRRGQRAIDDGFSNVDEAKVVVARVGTQGIERELNIEP